MPCKEVFRGAAVVRFRDYSGGPMVNMGNMRTVQITRGITVQNVANTQTIEGGNCRTHRQTDTVGLSIVNDSWQPNVMKLEEAGSLTTRTLTPVANEMHASWIGGWLHFKYIPDTTVPYVITDVGGATTYALGTDYDQTSSGVYLRSAAEGGSIIDPTSTAVPNVEVNYTSVAQSVIEPLQILSQDVAVFIEGANILNNGQRQYWNLYKVGFGASDTLDLISAEPAPLNLTGEVFADTGVTRPTGESNFYRMTKESLAA